MPPIEMVLRIPPLLLDRLHHQGIFTTGLLLEVSETPTRRQYLADQIAATINDVHAWRDEALLLNLASFGEREQAICMQAGIVGLADFLALDLETLKERLARAARELGEDPIDEITIEGWFEQARTLEEE